MSVVNDDARTSRCVSEKLQSTFWSRSSVKVSVMIGYISLHVAAEGVYDILLALNEILVTRLAVVVDDVIAETRIAAQGVVCFDLCLYVVDDTLCWITAEGFVFCG